MSYPSKTLILITSFTLFLVVLALEQIYDVILLYIVIPTLYYQLIYLLIPLTSIIAFILFVKLTKSSFKRHGFKHPTGIKTLHCTILSIAFITIYFSLILFSGLFGSFGPALFPTTLYRFMLRVAIAVTYGFASELVFRGYIFRNLVRQYGLFKALYASSLLFSVYTISIREIPSITSDPVIYIFTRIVPNLVAGLFLGFFFYKIRWSLIGPLIFRIGFLFFLEPTPIMAVSVSWWIALTFEILAFAILIMLADFLIKEPKARRKRYGLQ